MWQDHKWWAGRYSRIRIELSQSQPSGCRRCPRAQCLRASEVEIAAAELVIKKPSPESGE